MICAGHFHPDKGQVKCMNCDDLGTGFYQDMKAQTVCKSCPDATHHGRGFATNLSDCLCDVNFFSENYTAGEVRHPARTAPHPNAQSESRSGCRLVLHVLTVRPVPEDWPFRKFPCFHVARPFQTDGSDGYICSEWRSKTTGAIRRSLKFSPLAVQIHSMGRRACPGFRTAHPR